MELSVGCGFKAADYLPRGPCIFPKALLQTFLPPYTSRASLLATFTMIRSELGVCGKVVPVRSVRACGRMDVFLYPFSPSAVDGGQSSGSRSARLIPDERASSTN